MAIMVSLVSGCGGGSNGSGMTPDPDSSYGTMVSDISAILQSSDSLMMTDIVLADPNAIMIPEGIRVQASCSSGQCQALYGGYPVADISLSEFEFPDPANSTYEFSTGSGDVRIIDVQERQEEDGITTDVATLGAWLDHTAFAVEVSAMVSGVSNGVNLQGTVSRGAYSFGDATGTTPTFGNATWNGTMWGSETTSPSNPDNRVQGDVTLTFDLAQSNLDVTFANIRNVDRGNRYENMAWQDIPVISGSFSSEIEGNAITGQFYGSNHEEIGGIFERNQILGAFGARR